jgi:nitroimidazol reductase NimA-like FMN-containing flavoprotein (pyridoxamine 5'-phosphate oxidase superfamily)
MTHEQMAKHIMESVIYMNIATITPKGFPWNTPVYCAYDTDHNFYWASSTETQHSKNIASNQNVFVTIYDSTTPEGKGRAVYMSGTSVELTNSEEIELAVQICYDRKSKPRKPITDFQTPALRRMYKFTTKQIYINVDYFSLPTDKRVLTKNLFLGKKVPKLLHS